VISYRVAAQSLRRDAGAQLAKTAFDSSDKLDRLLFERYGDVQVFARSPQARTLRPAAITRWMTTASRVYEPNYALMVVAGLGGRIVAATSLDPYLTPRDTSRLIGLEVSGTSWYRAAVSPQARVVVEDAARDPLLARVPGLPPQGYAVSFSEPIRAVDGRVLGVWSNRLDWGVVRTVLHEAVATRAGEQGPAVHLYLLNRARSVIGSDRPVGRVRSQLRDISALGKEFDSDQGLARSSLVRDVPVSVLEHDARGVDIVSYFHSTGYSSYPGLGWTMLAAADRGRRSPPPARCARRCS
jgi:methyl-accepting chemotaxis protein